MSGIVGGRNIRGSGLVAHLGTDGQVLTSAGVGLQQVFEDASGGFTPGASAYASGSAQSISSGSWTQVTFGTENWDTDGDYASSTFTVGSGDGGKYLVTATLLYVNPVGGTPFQIGLGINGAVNTRYYIDDPVDTTANSRSLTEIFNLSATDTIGVYAYQNSGGTENLSYAAASTFMSVHRIG